MKLSDQIGINIISGILCGGGVLLIITAASFKDGTWAIAGSILIYAWVYLNTCINKE